MLVSSHIPDFRKFLRSFSLAICMLILLGFIWTADGATNFPLSLQPNSMITSPPVLLQAGTTGSSIVYANNTSAKVSVAPSSTQATYYPSSYNVVNGTYLSGSIPSSVQTLDTDYLTIRSVGSGTTTSSYYPSGYALAGSTTLMSGGVSDLTSDNGVYMTFRSYGNTSSATLQFYNSSDGQSSTTSQTYGDKVILTFTPTSTGNHLIVASAEIRGSSASYDVRALMTIDGTTYTNVTWQPDEANMWESFFTHKVISLDGSSHTVRIQYSSENAAQTVTIRRARIMALKLFSFENNEAENEQSITSGTYVDVVTRTFTPSTAGAYLIVATAEVRAASTSNSLSARLQIDGVAKDEMVTQGEATTDYEVFAAHNVTTLSAASHTVKIQASRETTGTMYIRRARITVLRLSDYYDYQKSGSEGVSSTSSTNWQDKIVLTFTPSATGNYLIMATAKINLATATNGYQPAINFTIDGTEYGYWQTGMSANDDYLTFATMINASLTAASHTLKIAYRTTSASYSANIRDARIVAVRLARQYISEVEFTSSSNTGTWTQFVWSVDSAWTTSSVAVTVQVYNYTQGGYPTSGNGYTNYNSSSTANTDETKTQTITTNSAQFRNATGYWKMRIKGVKTSGIQFDFKADWVEFKPTYYSEYKVSTEFTFSSLTTNAPTQLNFTVVSHYTITSVSVTIQVWNYSSSGYATSGEGYLTYTSTGTNVTKVLSLNTNPQFYTSGGNAKIKVTGINSTIVQFEQKSNQIKLVYSYVIDNVEDYVDNNTSNVDSSANKGTHGNFTAQKVGPDSTYDALQEQNTGGGGNWGITSSAFTVSSTHTDYRYMGGTSPNTDNMRATRLHIRYSGTGTVAIALYTGGTLTDPTGAVKRTEAYSVVVSNGWNTIDVPDYDWAKNTVTWIGWAHAGGSVYYSTSSADAGNFQSARGRWSQTTPADADETTSMPTNPGSGSFSNFWYAVYVEYEIINYELDLEVQWTNTTYSLPNEQLCIYGGTMGAENILVDVWAGSTWQNLFTDLSNGWNNVSVSSYLTSSTFTIRFKGGTETLDSTQDTWNIDATLLHSWGWTKDFNNVLKMTEVGGSNWKVRLEAYDQSNIGRLKNSSIYIYNGSNSTQIVIINGAYSQQTGSWYDLTTSDIEYIWMHVETSNTGTSYVYAYLEILIPNTTTYARYVITFKIT